MQQSISRKEQKVQNSQPTTKTEPTAGDVYAEGMSERSHCHPVAEASGGLLDIIYEEFLASAHGADCAVARGHGAVGLVCASTLRTGDVVGAGADGSVKRVLPISRTSMRRHILSRLIRGGPRS
jgi:hypothetical protein